MSEGLPIADESVSRTGGLRDLIRKARSGKALRGGAWSITGYAVQTGLRFISRIVLAKLMVDASPLGTVAVITTILMGLEMISDLGINVNIVQHRQGADPRFLGTAYSVQALRSTFLYVVATTMALPIAWIYHDPQLAPLLLFGATSVLLRGFANPGLSVSTRRVDLRMPTTVTIVSEVTGFIVTIAWAMHSPTAWALVAGTVATAGAYAVASHFAPTRARFAWDSRLARGLIHFGGWIILSTGTYFLSSRGEVLMLKGSTPSVEFGCFAFASMLVTTPISAITQLGSQVLLPTLAGWIRDDPDKIQHHFRRVKWAFTGLALCIAWGAILLGPPLVSLLHLNRSYASLAWMVQFLGYRAAMDVFASPVTNTLLASGASRYSAYANVVRLVILVAGLLVTAPFGLHAAIWVLVTAPLVAYVALLPGLRKHLPGSLGVELATLAAFLAGAAAAAEIATHLGGAWNGVLH